MKRNTPLKRGKPLARSPMKRKARPASETLRIYGPPERREWVKSLACLGRLCGGRCEGAIDNAHTVNGGKGRKADADTIVPMCRAHHRLYDGYKAPFDREPTRELMKSFAADVERAWQAKHSAGFTHISAVIPSVVASLLERTEGAA